MKTRHQEEITEDSRANTNVSHTNTNQTSSKQRQDSFSDWSNLKSGGCWIKQSKSNTSYLSGSGKFTKEALKKLIENEGKFNFHIYKNSFQEGGQPPYNLYIL
jgi:hypothetical protein